MRTRLIPAAVAVLIAGSVAPTPAFGTVTCDRLTATLMGTAGDDQLRGTPGDDVIAGLGGHDWIVGRGGNDTICGGAGRDSLEGGAGIDSLFGDRGDDSLVPGGGDDLAVAGPGRFHRFETSEGNDVYFGERDSLDLFDGYAAPAPLTIDLAAGTATGHGNDVLVGIDAVYGSVFDDTITGDDRPNSLVGRDGNDTLIGGGGGEFSGKGLGFDMFSRSDILVGDGGDDVLVGSNDYDVLLVFDAPGPMNIDLATGTATGEGDDTFSDIEGVVTSRQGDSVFGDDGDNAFAVAGRAELVDGRGGSDLIVSLYAFSGNEETGAVIDLVEGEMLASGTTMLVSIENAWGTRLGDMIRGSDEANTLNGRGGDDEIFGLDGDDRLQGGPGSHDLLDGGAGTDTCLSGETLRACEA